MARGRLTAWLVCLATTLPALLPRIALAAGGDLVLPDSGAGQIILHLDSAEARPPANRLAIFVGPGSACCAGRSPVSGRYRVEGDAVIFEPRFPLLEGQLYSALIDGATLREFIIGSNGLPPPEVVAVYPSGPVLPENTLRFYIEFASPMQPHRSETFIALERADGTRDRAAFMTFKQELWNADRTRLTLLMDPGRIKRGVATNMDLGPALEAGKDYALVIDAGWPSAAGQDLPTGVRAPFRVGDPLRRRPDVGDWTVSAPHLGTRMPLVLRFDRPYDRVQLTQAISLRNAAGQGLPGKVTVQDNETAWQFVPDTPWADPEITVVVAAVLEDVAGNNFRDVLDHALGTRAREVDQVTLSVNLRD